MGALSDQTRSWLIGAFGFRNVSESYLNYPIFEFSPFAYYVNLSFAIELSLKAFLSSKGWSDKKIKEVGHDLVKAWNCAVDEGLEICSEDVFDLIKILSDGHNTHKFRYLEWKSVTLPADDHQALDLVTQLHRRIGELVGLNTEHLNVN